MRPLREPSSAVASQQDTAQAAGKNSGNDVSRQNNFLSPAIPEFWWSVPALPMQLKNSRPTLIGISDYMPMRIRRGTYTIICCLAHASNVMHQHVKKISANSISGSIRWAISDLHHVTTEQHLLSSSRGNHQQAHAIKVPYFSFVCAALLIMLI